MWLSINRFYVEISQQKYNEYWTQISSVKLIPPIMHHTNTDAIGISVILGMDVTLPCTPSDPNTLYLTQHFSSSNTLPYLYPTRCYCIKISNHVTILAD